MSNSIDLKDLVIDESNFDQYFFDVRKHKPKPGQVLVKYIAMADFIDGQLKRDLINLLMTSKKTDSSVRVMKVLAGASDKDSVRIPKEIAKDLSDGMSLDEVAQKPYRFVFEQFFWAEKEAVPSNDPHWITIPIVKSKYTDRDGDEVDLNDYLNNEIDQKQEAALTTE